MSEVKERNISEIKPKNVMMKGGREIKVIDRKEEERLRGRRTKMKEIEGR